MTDLGWLDAIEARLRSEAAIAARPGQMGRLEGIADDVARLVAAFRGAQGHIEFKAEEIRGLRREVEEATRLAGYWRMKVARVDVIWESDDGHATYCESLTTGRGRDCNCWRATIGAILEETE